VRSVDPVELAIFQSAFHSIAEEMGAALRRTGFSPNIKERRDYSCALFNSAGEVFAMGDHMPVHLGSMPMSVSKVLKTLRLERGDIAVLNDPYAGGTHLPDLTMVMPVFVSEAKRAAFYVASRAHHADVGGMHAGSMGLCREIFQEGLRIPPVRIERRGRRDTEILSMILSNVRTPAEREGDLTAQIGSCRIGLRRLQELTTKHGLKQRTCISAIFWITRSDSCRLNWQVCLAANTLPRIFWTTTGLLKNPSA
jgi:N-methylhydantoinase B